MAGGLDSINVGNFGGASGIGSAVRGGGSASGSVSFSDVLKGQIDEVAKLQQDASQAVEDLTLGKTDDVTGVMTAMEKSDVAFKTLLAIRGKLMEAYDEVRNIPL
jgi:flagellar hook-basal body complex protein FliE